MSKLKKERLNQMIENALSYKQQVKTIKSNSFYMRFKGLISRPNIYGYADIDFRFSCYSKLQQFDR